MIRRLVLPLALVAVISGAAWGRDTSGEPVPPDSARLPWTRLVGLAGPAALAARLETPAASDAPSPTRPHALLYVSATCPHCEGVARYADSLAASTGMPLVMVSADPPAAMAAWGRRTGVRAPILTDSALAMRRALLVRFVPTLVAWHGAGEARRVTGANRRAIRLALERRP